MATRRRDFNSGDDGPEDGIRLSDPDEYNQSRRLRQLHNAKEAVVSTKDQNVEAEIKSDISVQQRDRIIAEKLIDYIREVLALLEQQNRADELLDEPIGQFNGQMVSIDTIVSNHGRVRIRGNDGERKEWIPYEMSMETWHIVNRYFEEIAGPEFETDGTTAKGEYSDIV